MMSSITFDANGWTFGTGIAADITTKKEIEGISIITQKSGIGKKVKIA